MARDDILEELRLIREDISSGQLNSYRLEQVEKQLAELRQTITGNGAGPGVRELVRALQRDVETLMDAVAKSKSSRKQVSVALITAIGALLVELFRQIFRHP